MKRGASALSLLLGIDKDCGPSSHDCVNAIRRITGERRVGHAGTLDPLAEGILVVGVGSATRLCQYVMGQSKYYEAVAAFGISTDTDDAWGHIIDTRYPSSELLSQDCINAYLAKLVGTFQQKPPAYCARKSKGKVSYKQARNGRMLSLEPRQVSVYSAEYAGISCMDEIPALQKDFSVRLCFPSEIYNRCALVKFRFEVSKGCYVRSLIRDMGSYFGCPAHVVALKRTKSGSLELNACHKLSDIKGFIGDYALNPFHVLGMPTVSISDGQIKRVINGQALPACELTGVLKEDTGEGFRLALLYDSQLCAIYRYNKAREQFMAECVFSPGVYCG